MMQAKIKGLYFFLIAIAALYSACLAIPLTAHADTACVPKHVYSSTNDASYVGNYTVCIPLNFDKNSYTPGSAVTVSGSYPYYVANGNYNFADTFSITTPTGQALPQNANGNYSYSFTAQGVTGSYPLSASAIFYGYVKTVVSSDPPPYQYTCPDGTGTDNPGDCQPLCPQDGSSGCIKVEVGHPGAGGGGTRYRWDRTEIAIDTEYTVACSQNEVANNDGTCSKPAPPTATITANGASGSINVTVRNPVRLDASFAANAPDIWNTTGIQFNGGWYEGGNDGSTGRTAFWTPQNAGSYTFSAQGATADYPNINPTPQVTVNVADQTCTPPTSTITGNGAQGSVSVTVGTPLNLNATFAAGSGDTLTSTGIADSQNNWLAGGTGASTPRTFSWNPSAQGSYVFYARAATSNCALSNYGQLVVTVTCPANYTQQTNGGVSGCCPANQTLNASGQCMASPNPPTATITANGTSGKVSVTVGTPINFNATFIAKPGDSLTTTGISDYQDAWLSGGTGATSPRTYTWTPTLARTYSFNARTYTSAFPSPTCFHGNCDYDTVTVTASCPSNQTQQSDGSCVTAGPPTATLTANGQTGTVNVIVGQSVALHSTFSAGVGDTINSTGILNYNDTQYFAQGSNSSPLDASWTPTVVGSYGFNAKVGTTNFAPSDKASVTLSATCAAGETQQANGTCAGAPSVTASLTVGTYNANLEGYSCTAQSATINSGDSIMMCWACTGATSNTSTNFSTGGQLNGQTVLSPSQTTSYSLQCANQTASANSNAIVNVSQSAPPPPPPPSSVTISANPTRVRKGSTTSLAWSGQNVNSCKVTDDKGNILSTVLTSTSRFTTDSINSRTVFSISCVGKDGKNPSTSVTVDIAPSFIEF